jgi:hypothetical protein
MWLGENPSEYDQFNATDAFNRTARSLHHIRSYRETLEEGERSKALTNWEKGYKELYGRMHREAQLGEDAADIRLEPKDKATKFADDYTAAFWQHFKELPSAYQQETPKPPRVRGWHQTLQPFSKDQTTRPSDVSQGDGHTRGSQVRGEEKMDRRLGISRANPNRRDNSGTDS